MTDKQHEQVVLKARKEAHALLKKLYPLDLLPAAEYIRNNPPSPEAIAMLGFHVHEVLDKAQRSADGKKGIEARYQNQVNLKRALQEIVNKSVAQLIKEGKKTTLNNVLDKIIMNQETSVKISDCEIGIEGDKIVCTDNHDDTKISLKRRSFERYVTKAKKPL